MVSFSPAVTNLPDVASSRADLVLPRRTDDPLRRERSLSLWNASFLQSMSYILPGLVLGGGDFRIGFRSRLRFGSLGRVGNSSLRQ
jgi:hypothetical protein